MAQIALPLLLPFLAFACHGPLNDTNGLYDSNPLPALTVPSPNTAIAAEPVGGVAPLDRADWPQQTIRIQAAQVQHEPTYRTATPIIASSQRASGSWPTPDTAVRTHVNNNAAALNGVLQPVGAGVDILLLPVEMIITPPWRVTRSSARDTSTALTPEYVTKTPWHWVQPRKKETNATAE